MNNTFLLNPSISALDLKDAIDERLKRAEAIAHCLLFTRDAEIELNRDTFYNVLWSICELFDEVDFLRLHPKLQSV